jgi:membrane protein
MPFLSVKSYRSHPGKIEDKVPRLGAALAYYSIFSIGPLLLIVIALLGLFFEREAVTTQLTAQIQGVVGEQAADTIRAMADNASKPSSSIPALIVGIVVLLFGAAGVFGQLQDSLNTIWEVKPKPGRGILGMVRDRFLSLTMVFGIAFLLLISLVISTAIAAMSRFIGSGLGEAAAHIANFVISFGVITILFAMIYKVLPDAVIAWSDVWIGAVVTSLLFGIGKFLIGLYLARSSVASVYGAAGSLVIVLLWVYYSAQILLLGAEFTQVYANQFGFLTRGFMERSDFKPADAIR